MNKSHPDCCCVLSGTVSVDPKTSVRDANGRMKRNKEGISEEVEFEECETADRTAAAHLVLAVTYFAQTTVVWHCGVAS